MKKTCAICCAVLLASFLFYHKGLHHALLLKAGTPSIQSVPLEEKDLENIKKILKGPLTFLGCGSQCFAFTSADGEFAVKLCKASRYRSFFPSEGKDKKIRDFLSYSLAYHSLPEQSQVVFLHLDKTDNLKTPIEVVDPFGLSHFVEADNIAFYVQRKATPLPDYLKDLPPSEARDLAKKLLHLFSSCCKEGLKIQDIYSKNIGVYNGEPLWIDPGRIKEKPTLKEQAPQEKALRRFTSLLSQTLDDDFASVLKEELELVSY